MDTPQYSCDRLAFHFDNQKSREMKAANALGAKTARACHSCLRRRASWFCAADDAFLCQGCDNLVHSANQLASRHERVRLQTASSSKANWFSGFKRKARSPRHSKHLLAQQRPKDEEEELFNNISTLPVVPDLGNEEPLLDETEDQLLCRVPVFDPFDEVLCDVYSDGGDEILETTMKKDVADDEEITCDLDNFSEFLSSDVDLAEFAADVESLLGSGVDEDSGEMKGSELFDGGGKSAMMKVKDENHEADETACYLESFLDMTSEALNWNIIDSQSPAQEEEEKVVAINDCVGKVETENKNIFLRLNYEEVITAWASQGSPWTTGNLPQFNSHDCWPDFLGLSGGDVQRSYGEVGRLRGQIVDGGREAIVSRYREKRRTRLFAKKIRYEVRKLNAEKRPRMKGRFVKRTSFVGGATTALPAYH